MSNPILTVSVAAYNVEDYLPKALGSCLGELDTGRLEVIVVDDGSTDGTSEIADWYALAYPELFHVVHKENGHYGSAVNTSLPLATGKYFRLLDSDDWFDSEALSKYLDILEMAEADACCTSSVRHMLSSGETILMDPCPDAQVGEWALGESGMRSIPGPGISNLAYKTSFIKAENFLMLEGCGYVDEEMRAIPWCHVKTVRIDHIPVYQVLKEREGQSTSLKGLRRAARDKMKLFEHVMEVGHFGVKDSRSIAQSMAFEVACDIAAGAYNNMLLLEPSRSVKAELIEFNRLLKDSFPEVYSVIGKRCKKVRALRATRFISYGLIARQSAWKWRCC